MPVGYLLEFLVRMPVNLINAFIIFLLFILAFVKGSPETLIYPRDSSGARCGFDHHVKNKPYLYFFDLTKCVEPSVAFSGCNTPQVNC